MGREFLSTTGSTLTLEVGGRQPPVCAVIVTYNRQDLLRECLQAVLAQTHAVAGIHVINNRSTDGTLEMLASEFAAERHAQMRVDTLEENVGGAGGFHEGLKRAAAEHFEWLWLMDDDTIPNRDALAQLLQAHERFADTERPNLLASQVLWIDGTLHPMNMPWIKQEAAELYAAARCRTLPLRTATFVSLLVRRSVVDKFGLPIKGYFLAADDVEYTARILQAERGVLVPDSTVVHKTVTKTGTLDGPPAKFYYYVRNTIWMFTRSQAFEGWQKAKYVARFILSLVQYSVQRPKRVERLRSVGRGVWHGLTQRP